MRKDYHAICSLPEEIESEKRGDFRVFVVKCGYAFDHRYTTETYHVRDKEGEVLKTFHDLEDARIYAGKQYGDSFDRQNNDKNGDTTGPVKV